MIGLDTNVLVRYLVMDDKKQAAIADRAIQEAVEAGHFLMICGVVLAETVWVLEDVYGFGKSEILSALDRVLSTAEFSIENRDAVRQALEDFRNGSADFADCIIGRTNRNLECENTLTFDRNLRYLETFQVL
jgi:predicted nucleic-acid-binding protein